MALTHLKLLPAAAAAFPVGDGGGKLKRRFGGAHQVIIRHYYRYMTDRSCAANVLEIVLARATAGFARQILRSERNSRLGEVRRRAFIVLNAPLRCASFSAGREGGSCWQATFSLSLFLNAGDLTVVAGGKPYHVSFCLRTLYPLLG